MGEPPALVKPAADQVLSLNLAECLHMALERQPALAAHRASLAAAEAGSRGLNDLHIPTFLARELPIRRKQASLGVVVASAGLDQGERETIYAVTRTYHSEIFATEQLKLAKQIVDRFKAIKGAAEAQVKGGSRDVTSSSVDKIVVYQRLAELRVKEAERGIRRATAGLHEAIGLDPQCCLCVAGNGFPGFNAPGCCDDIIALALARRGEMVQATTIAQVTCLEIDAQGTSCKPNFHTFASAVDLHARSIPQGISNSEYRPGALGPEMPTSLAGSKSARMERARALSARADAVVEKTRNLIALEAEDAYIKWEESNNKMQTVREAAEKAEKLAKETADDFVGQQAVKIDEVLANQVLWGQAQALYNEAQYQRILALAALERVSGGGFCAGLAGSAPAIPRSTILNSGPNMIGN
jgi:outer membrane protein TolC